MMGRRYRHSGLICLLSVGILFCVMYIVKLKEHSESCSGTVHIFSAVAQAKKYWSLIEFIVLNVLDGSIDCKYDCCIYGDNELYVHREQAIIKETYNQHNELAMHIAKQYQCSVQQINFKTKNIQLVGDAESCNFSLGVHSVIYPAVKENEFAICTKIAYNYLNPLHLIEWFEYQKIMFVDTVLISLQNINEDAHTVFKYYEREGIAKLIPYPSKLPGDIDRGFEMHRWHYHQSTHDEQVAVYSCKEILQGFAFVAVVDFDEFIVHPRFLAYRNILMSELLPMYPDAAVFTLNASFFITDWGVSGVEPLLTSKYIRRSKPLFHRIKNIYLPNRTDTMDTHTALPREGYRRFILRSHNVLLHHYRKCKRSDNISDECVTFSRNTDTKMMKIMPSLYEKVVPVTRRCGLPFG